MKRVLLFGAGGQIGQALAAEPLPDGWDLRGVTRAECDITNHGAVQKLLRDLQPDIIVNAAAMTNVDACERDHQAAVNANFESVANLAAQCSAMDLPLIQLSTDYVFDGRGQSQPYPVDAQMNPLNIYGETKMLGEIALRNELAWHVILRVSSVFSEYGANILTKLLANLAQNPEVRLVNDQTACPTYAPDIAAAIIDIAAQVLRGKYDAWGTFHYCGAPAATRYEFGQAVMQAYAAYTDKRPALSPAATSDFPGFAERPAYSVLDCGKIKAVYGIEQKNWRGGVGQAIKRLHGSGTLPA